MNIEQARFNMIEQQIRPWDVLDAGVLSLLAVVRREDFVPSACKALAFMDTEIPLVGGQSMMAALLGHKAQRVISLEINAELAAFATANLERAGVMNVKVLHQDGAKGLPGEAPFDVILLSGSVAEVPAVLLAQLKVGGRLAAIVGDLPVMRAQLITRVGESDYRTTTLFDTAAPRLQGFVQRNAFAF